MLHLLAGIYVMTLYIHFAFDVYDGPIHDTLYKVKRPFVNKIIFLFDPWQSPTGHVIEGRAYEDRPPNIKIEYNLF